VLHAAETLVLVSAIILKLMSDNKTNAESLEISFGKMSSGIRAETTRLEELVTVVKESGAKNDVNVKRINFEISRNIDKLVILAEGLITRLRADKEKALQMTVPTNKTEARDVLDNKEFILSSLWKK